jgi:hypothetical protein
MSLILSLPVNDTLSVYVSKLLLDPGSDSAEICMFLCMKLCIMCIFKHEERYPSYVYLRTLSPGMYVCMHACMHVCIIMYVCMYVCLHACMYVCVCTYIYIPSSSFLRVNS